MRLHLQLVSREYSFVFMKKIHVELLLNYCSDSNQPPNLELMFDRGEITMFKDKYKLKETVNLLLETGYLESMNYHKYTVMITDEGSSFIQQSYVRIRWYLFSDFVRSISGRLDKSNTISVGLGSLLTLFFLWIFDLLKSWF